MEEDKEEENEEEKSEFEKDIEEVEKEVEEDDEAEFAYPGRRTLLSAQKLKKSLEEIKVPSLEVIRDEHKKKKEKTDSE